jgi:hypothetical protein
VSKDRGRWRRRPLLAVLVVGALAAACLCCCLVPATLVGRSDLSGVSTGLSIQFCVGVVTTPRLQVGVAWYSPLSSFRGPLAGSPYAFCGDVPWPKTPRSLYGEWMFPP